LNSVPNLLCFVQITFATSGYGSAFNGPGINVLLLVLDLEWFGCIWVWGCNAKAFSLPRYSGSVNFQL